MLLNHIVTYPEKKEKRNQFYNETLAGLRGKSGDHDRPIVGKAITATSVW